MRFGNIQQDYSIESSRNHERHRKTVAALSLVVSVALHLAAIALVLIAYREHSSLSAVTYIDIKNIASPPSSPPMVQSYPNSHVGKNLEEPPPAAPPVNQEAPLEQSKSAVQEIQSTNLGRGMMHGYFSSFAEGKNLRDDLREYYLMLLEKINERWWIKAGAVTETQAQDAVVVFVIGKGGEIVDLKIRRSSGSREVDRAITETIREMTPFPSLPGSYTLDEFLVPLKISAPLKLFR